jgi:hypothetical protein
MKPYTSIFNVFIVFCLFACGAPRKTATPAEELPPPVNLPASAANTGRTDTLLVELLRRNAGFFGPYLADPNRYRIQVIYTQVNRSSSNKPSFTHYYYNVDPSLYFYPASTVKLPVAALALQRLRALESVGVTASSTMITEKAAPWQTMVANDPTTTDGRPTIEQYIKKILLVSDNDAYNRLYEFLGQAYINNTLHGLGYDSVQVLHRLQLPLTEAQNRATNPVRFFDADGRLLYSQPAQQSSMAYQPRNTFLGKAYISNGSRVEAPFDFSKRNRLSLPDLHSMLTAIIFPDEVSAPFRLRTEDYTLLRRYMSMKPSESRYPQYDSSYGDNYSRFLLFGGKGTLPPGMRIFSKEGDAYGFLTDAAYIVDFEKGIEFFLSATIYCNADETFNDDQYDYENIGMPFLQNLGRVIYEYEQQRPRRTRPDLSAFMMDYTR